MTGNVHSAPAIRRAEKAARRIIDERRSERSPLLVPTAGQIIGGFAGFLTKPAKREAIWQCVHQHDGRAAARRCASEELKRRVAAVGL